MSGVIQDNSCRLGHHYTSVGLNWWGLAGGCQCWGWRRELEERCLEGDVTDQWQGVSRWQSEKEENLEQLPGFLIDQILGVREGERRAI